MILLVEDNQDDIDLALRAFAKAGVKQQVEVAHDGEEALQRLLPPEGGQRLKPTVVLLDLNLPRVSGFEVLRKLRRDERTRLLPVVILTSSAEDRDLIEGYQTGANSYVRKPVDFSHFVEAVKSLGVYWLVFNLAAPIPA